MASDRLSPNDTVSLEFLRRADPICAQFEDAWRRGERPDIWDHLLSGGEVEQDWLLGHLLQIEMECRARLNEHPNAEEYRKRFPNHHTLIDALIQEFISAGVTLEVIVGPHKGRKFTFNRHDQFLVGRSVPRTHFRLPLIDPYFSRMHFLVEVNPPHCHLVDLCSLNGTKVNGELVESRRLEDGDLVHCGQTTILVSLKGDAAVSDSRTLAAPPQAAESRASDVPTSIGGHQIVRQLGRGGMGVVYLARRISDGKEFAIKTIRPTVTVAERETERFRREASILCSLKHPKIVSFHQMGREGDAFYIVMDYIAGTNLSDHLMQNGPMNIQQAGEMISQVLQALEFAHSHGFVHRDVKPANILMTADGGCLLADFGLARVYNESRMSGITVLGEVGGTVPFMPPEQIKDYRRVRPSADQYSAAATLYYALTGRFAYDFDSGRQNEQLMHVLLKRPVPISVRRPDISPAIAMAIHRAMEKRPEDRFANVAEFRSKLLQAIRSSQIS